MIPKVQSAFETLAAGVDKVHIVDGRVKHSLLLEIFTDEGIGTQLVHDAVREEGETR
jgi:acetylglutamate kinase